MSLLRPWAYIQSRSDPISLDDTKNIEYGTIKEGATDLPVQNKTLRQSETQELPSSTIAFQIPELLGQIFGHCLPDTIYGLPTANPDNSPVLLTRVCRLWRRTALRTPQLWTSLRLICFPAVPCKVLAANHIELLNEWSKRSGSCPISLELKYFGLWVSDVHMIRKILATILPYSHRWRMLDVTAPMSSLHALLPLIGPGTPSLESCRITVTSSIASEPELALAPFRLAAVNMDLTPATKLKQLSLKSDVDTDFNFSGLPSGLEQLSVNNAGILFDKNIRCGSLRRITLLHVNMSLPLLRILASSLPLLDDLYLDMSSFSADDTLGSPFGPPAIIFPSLQTFVIRTVKQNGVEGMNTTGIILDHISCPALRTLILRISFALEMPWPYLAQNLARTRPPLEELSMMGTCLDETEFIEILKEAPTLRTLQACVRLSDIGVYALTLNGNTSSEYEPSFTDATVKSIPTNLCPNLTSLDIPISISCSPASIISMILSRNISFSRTIGDFAQLSLIESSNINMRNLLQDVKLILSSPGAVDQVYRHPGIKACTDRGMQLDLLPF